MSRRPPSLSDRLLLRAWIEPAHEQPLRVIVRRQKGANTADEERAFTDADRASGFVREWLLGLVRRWEGGERTDGIPPAGEGKE